MWKWATSHPAFDLCKLVRELRVDDNCCLMAHIRDAGDLQTRRTDALRIVGDIVRLKTATEGLVAWLALHVTQLRLPKNVTWVETFDVA